MRDNCHAHDVCTAFQAFYESPRRAAVYNLGGGRANSVSLLEAITALEKVRVATAGHPATLSALAHALASAGRIEEARALIERLAELSARQHISPFWMAVAHAGVGKTAAALEELEKAFEQHDVTLVWLARDPRLDNLRHEPRFKDLLRGINLLPNPSRERIIRGMRLINHSRL